MVNYLHTRPHLSTTCEAGGVDASTGEKSVESQDNESRDEDDEKDQSTGVVHMDAWDEVRLATAGRQVGRRNYIDAQKSFVTR